MRNKEGKKINTYGMDKNEVIRELKLEIEKDPDLKYYLNNEYVEKMFELLIEVIENVIEKNNKKVEEDKKGLFCKRI
ncbi:MAG TPA: hypothetical protein DD613_05605 [Firmicutes bacterium]|nr:hypothetical protein [Bacillota bacterium]